QQSGQMEPMLERLAKDYDRQAATLASRVTTVTEPVLIIVLALIVGFIMFATILPILEAGNVLME
ncbi:MAG: type II secretion system F family protein, partial [Planctomycetaceae bacterium]|nr:type II secretion system F family protein [Planctomycetaceae bacterium]